MTNYYIYPQIQNNCSYTLILKTLKNKHVLSIPCDLIFISNNIPLTFCFYDTKKTQWYFKPQISIITPPLQKPITTVDAKTIQSICSAPPLYMSLLRYTIAAFVESLDVSEQQKQKYLRILIMHYHK
jgi:hypothetical protein